MRHHRGKNGSVPLCESDFQSWRRGKCSRGSSGLLLFLLCSSSWEQRRYNGVRTEFSHAWPVTAARPRRGAAPERTVYIKEREGGQRGLVIAAFHLYTLHFLPLCSLCVFCLCVSVWSYIFLTAWFGSSLADVSAA